MKKIKTKKHNSWLKAGVLIPLILIGFFLSFFLGLNWNLFITETIHTNKLRCFGYNNFWETFQTDCVYPLNSQQKKFKYSENLKCSLITNHQLHNTLYTLSSSSIDVDLTKTDYRNFTLKFESKKNVLIKSQDPGEHKKEPFIIIQNDEKVLSGKRKTELDNFFGYEYQYIFLSKKTGKGMTSWINTEDYSLDQDSLAAEYFQCE